MTCDWANYAVRVTWAAKSRHSPVGGSIRNAGVSPLASRGVAPGVDGGARSGLVARRAPFPPLGRSARAPRPPTPRGADGGFPLFLSENSAMRGALPSCSGIAVSGSCGAILGVFGQNRGVEDLTRLDDLNWKPLVSGHLEAVAWRDSLFIRFPGGEVYKYPAPEAELSGIVNAMSAGMYLHGRIEKRWPGVRVT